MKWKLGFIGTTGEQSILNPNPKPLALTIQKRYWHWRIPAVTSAVTDLLTGGFEVSVDEMGLFSKLLAPLVLAYIPAPEWDQSLNYKHPKP